ncbi:DUF222 domain-containing protein [Agromyces sp. CFH 90414]|uniref:DUF222 domain-containing protein n=1 Tax=Agromyces agglutinans TaxID=2662258 RepID=A0A6I2F6W6_9MICO|nr:HNH endonuclease signature motif containing protein [Agromyces agglutinans]MRG59994.1 DUF222 domain-containing protein [Agromyces agglutinans]
MPSTRDALEQLRSMLARELEFDRPARCTDDELLAELGTLEAVGRLVDAHRSAYAGEVAERSRVELGDARLSRRRGCRSAAELIERVTQVSGSEARRRIALGEATRARTGLRGDPAPARYPAIAAALATGDLGVDAAASVIRELEPARPVADPSAFAAAERALVDEAIAAGESPVRCTADELRVQAQAWSTLLDQDGREPDDERAMRRRGLRLGRARGGLVPLAGELMPEVAAQLRRLFDAYLSPRSGLGFQTAEERAESAGRGAGAGEQRTADQQRHDVLAAALDSAARSGEHPSIGGAPPTVLVSVRAADLRGGGGRGGGGDGRGERDEGGGRGGGGDDGRGERDEGGGRGGGGDLRGGDDRHGGRDGVGGRGVAYAEGVDAPISLRAVRRMICTGGTQSVVFDDAGRLIALGSPERCFTPHQRRAITVRDGGCIIPGCSVPAAWCEIHHVVPDAAGGATHPDNGVLLCWFHHRSIDTSGWGIRMIRGVPHVRPPAWLDPGGGWRPSTKSPTRLADRREREAARARGAPAA